MFDQFSLQRIQVHVVDFLTFFFKLHTLKS